jgi:biopolymer transport protein ExbD
MHGDAFADDEPMATMNFIPLIDIALTLVIILMVTTVFIKKPGVQLKLPETKTQEGAPETPKDLTVSIGADGKFYVDGRPQSESQVRGQLARVAAKNKNGRVLVKGDRAVQYERVMTVMDLARQAGLTKIILPTDPKPPQLLGSEQPK